jgi:hypothetical protein
MWKSLTLWWCRILIWKIISAKLYMFLTIIKFVVSRKKCSGKSPINRNKNVMHTEISRRFTHNLLSQINVNPWARSFVATYLFIYFLRKTSKVTMDVKISCWRVTTIPTILYSLNNTNQWEAWSHLSWLRKNTTIFN